MEINTLSLPDDIIKYVNKINALKFFDEYMVFENDYVFDTGAMREFIKKIIELK